VLLKGSCKDVPSRPKRSILRDRKPCFPPPIPLVSAALCSLSGGNRNASAAIFSIWCNQECNRNCSSSRLAETLVKFSAALYSIWCSWCNYVDRSSVLRGNILVSAALYSVLTGLTDYPRCSSLSCGRCESPLNSS
jgi:hypothetical protein